MSVRDSESRTARVSVATVAVVAMASDRDAVAAEANHTRENAANNAEVKQLAW